MASGVDILFSVIDVRIQAWWMRISGESEDGNVIISEYHKIKRMVVIPVVADATL